jgi:hypothetical protein
VCTPSAAACKCRQRATSCPTWLIILGAEWEAIAFIFVHTRTGRWLLCIAWLPISQSTDYHWRVIIDMPLREQIIDLPKWLNCSARSKFMFALRCYFLFVIIDMCHFVFEAGYINCSEWVVIGSQQNKINQWNEFFFSFYQRISPFMYCMGIIKNIIWSLLNTKILLRMWK